MKTPLSALACLTLLACSSVDYDDPTREETLTIDYGSTDLQTLSAEMVESLVAAPAMAYAQATTRADPRVVLYMGDFENRTAEHIDTRGIADKMQTALLKSGKFRLVAGDAGQRQIGDQVRFQQESGRVREDLMRSFGKQLGADMILYGTLRSIEKKKGSSLESGLVRRKDVYYQFVLRCVDIETAEILWQEEAELRKTSRTGIFGRT